MVAGEAGEFDRPRRPAAGLGPPRLATRKTLSGNRRKDLIEFLDRREGIERAGLRAIVVLVREAWPRRRTCLCVHNLNGVAISGALKPCRQTVDRVS